MKRGGWCGGVLVVFLSAAGDGDAMTPVQSRLGPMPGSHEPTPAGESSLLVDMPRFGNELFSMGFSFDYAHRPLVLGVEHDNGRFQTLRVLIEHQLLGHVELAASLCDCILLSFSLPVLLMRRGDFPAAAALSARVDRRAMAAAVEGGAVIDLLGDNPSKGLDVSDPRLGLLLRVYGHPDTSPFSISAGGYLWLPLGGGLERATTLDFRAMSRIVLAGFKNSMQWSFTAAFLYHPKSNQDSPRLLGDNMSSLELMFGARAHYVDKARDFSLGPETMLSTVAIPRGHVLEPFSTSLDLLLGTQVRLTQTLRVGLSAGMGVLRRPGTPDFRFQLRVTVTPPPASANHQSALRPSQAPRPLSLIPLTVPLLVPTLMIVPMLAENVVEVPASTNAPRDLDQDTVLDSVDTCPDQPGTPSMDRARSGCPGLVLVKDGRLILQQPLVFASGTDRVLKESLPVLRAMADALQASPWIRKIRVEGHTDNQGAVRANNSLSTRRALQVTRSLQQYGIEPARMEAMGYGPSRPVTTNDTQAGRAANRRVDIVIVAPSTE